MPKKITLSEVTEEQLDKMIERAEFHRDKAQARVDKLKLHKKS